MTDEERIARALADARAERDGLDVEIGELEERLAAVRTMEKREERRKWMDDLIKSLKTRAPT